MSLKKQRISVFISIVVLIVLNILASSFFKRFDLTENKRYTLSQSAKNIVTDVDQPIIIDVYLKGEFPSAYKRLQRETRYLLEEFSAYNSQIKFNFINPLEDGGDAQEVAQKFYQAGMTPKTLNVYENGKTSESIMFPWAVATYKNQSTKINLLKRNVGDSQEETVNNSVAQLEYIFADGFNKIVNQRSKKIAVMRGNGELPDAFIADFIQEMREYYYIAPFTLDSVASAPQQTLQKLKEFDLILEAKPTEKYTEKEKYVLDQYLMNGGKALWLTESVAIEKDSLFTNPQNTALAYPRDLNLTDFFFKYGIRINPNLINDIDSAPIILASGSGNQTEFNPYPWFYSPLAVTQKKHPIVNNIEAVKFDFANPIDTLKNNINKTILLKKFALHKS